jgi:hypothetical protein
LFNRPQVGTWKVKAMKAILLSSALLASLLTLPAFAAMNANGLESAQSVCGARWKAEKATRAEGATWPKYWSECAKVVKAERKGNAEAVKSGLVACDTDSDCEAKNPGL